MKIDAVFQGGGIKGIGFVGAINCIEDNGYEWERVAGTSAGSIIAALLSAGYTGSELKEIMLSSNYNNFLDKGMLKRIPFVSDAIALIKDKGVFSGDPIEVWLEGLLKKKGISKFKDVTVNGETKLKIIAADITKRNTLILPDDLKNYGIDPMEFSIAKAVRMSISIPFVFEPVKLEYFGGTSWIVDGGLLSNFPIWIYDVEGTPRWPTFGFKFLSDSISHTALGKQDIISYSLDIIDAMLERNEEIYLPLKNSVRTINIDAFGIKGTDFKISKEMYSKLYDSGYKSVKKFLDNWNFKQYILKYRSKF